MIAKMSAHMELDMYTHLGILLQNQSLLSEADRVVETRQQLL